MFTEKPQFALLVTREYVQTMCLCSWKASGHGNSGSQHWQHRCVAFNLFLGWDWFLSVTYQEACTEMLIQMLVVR